MNLFHQLTKMANVYYMIICLLQMIDAISITGGLPTNAPPLAFVIFVSMVKDFFEDRVRQKSDQAENDKLTQVQDYGRGWRTVKWRDVKVGNVVKVMENEMIPADMVILATASNNVCYVETKDIDGETNLKHKVVPSG